MNQSHLNYAYYSENRTLSIKVISEPVDDLLTKRNKKKEMEDFAQRAMNEWANFCVTLGFSEPTGRWIKAGYKGNLKNFLEISFAGNSYIPEIIHLLSATTLFAYRKGYSIIDFVTEMPDWIIERGDVSLE